MDTLFLLMTAGVIFLIGLSKGGLGGTLGALATPLMALVMPADQVIGLLLPILMVADVFTVAAHWQRWERRLAWLLIPGSVAGVAVGSLLIASISADALRRGLGIITLLFVVYKLFENRLLKAGQYRPQRWHSLLAGGVAGFTSALAHTGGPPIAIYLLMQNLKPRAFVATSALFFTALNWIKVPSYYYIGLFDWGQLQQVLWLLPLLPVSVWVGVQIAEKIDKASFDRLITGLLAVSGLLLLVR